MASMAALVRPSILRHIPISQRLFATRAFNGSAMKLSKNLRNPSQTSQNPLSGSKSFQHTSPIICQLATFHATAQRLILPPLPQRLEGTANDPAPVPPPNPTHGSYHWTFERTISAALIPLTIAPFAAGSLNPIIDATLCATILIHSHIGFESIIIDYIPRKRLPKTRFLFWWGLRTATLVVAVGLYEFETNDVGLTEAIKRIWTA